GSARGLALVLLEALGGERAHDVVGLGAPSVGVVEPVHATVLAQLVQPIRALHVAPSIAVVMIRELPLAANEPRRATEGPVARRAARRRPARARSARAPGCRPRPRSRAPAGAACRDGPACRACARRRPGAGSR